MSNNKPKDALLQMDGSFYKIGLQRFVYIWCEDEWKRSKKEPQDLILEAYKEAKVLKARIARLEPE